MSRNPNGGCWRELNKLPLASSGCVIVDDRARGHNRKTTPPPPLAAHSQKALRECGLSALRAPGARKPAAGDGRCRGRGPGVRHSPSAGTATWAPSLTFARSHQRRQGFVKGSMVPSLPGSGKSAPPGFQPPQAGGALSGGPTQRLSRFRRTRKVRLGGTAAPGHTGACGCPECPASHPPPWPAFL